MWGKYALVSCVFLAACADTENPTSPLEPQTPQKACTPGETRCATDQISVLRCNDTGEGWCYVADCGGPPFHGLCAEGTCVAVCDPSQKSYMGCDYVAVDLDNANVPCGTDAFGDRRYCNAAAAPFAVVVSNPDPRMTAYVRVTRGPLSARSASIGSCEVPPVDENFVRAVRIPPFGVATLNLPRYDIEGTCQVRRAYRVASNVPIAAYQFNPLDNVDVFSNDASLLLPTTALGTDYLVMTRESTFDRLKGFVTVVGVGPDPVEVTVIPSADTFPGESIAGLVAGQAFTTTLGPLDVLNLETLNVGGDLTGTRVRSSGPVAVFGGSEAANVPNIKNQAITCCADHLEQQMFPLDLWGTTYVAARSYPRGLEQDYWRILASVDDTRVVLDPPVVAVPVLNAGQWFEFGADGDFSLVANKPVLLGQFLASQDAPNPGKQPGDAGIGDPSFMLTVPNQQLRSDYVFLAPDKYAEDYISVALPEGEVALLDGQDMTDIPGILLAAIGQSHWVSLRVPIADGYHQLQCSAPCSVMVHGYDQYVSYGYPGGMDLRVGGDRLDSQALSR